MIVRLADASEGAAENAVGFGEAAPIPHFGTESTDEIESACRELGEWLDASRLESIPARLVCLRHALAAARAGVMAAVTAGQLRRDEIAGATTPGLSTLGMAALLPAGPAALPAIAPKADLGFRVFKWKVGVGDVADELGLLDDVCAALPDRAKLRLDANGAWDRRKAERWLERCADRPIEFVEQPCFADLAQSATDRRRCDDLLLGLAENFPTPLALDESLVGDADIERWIGAGWPGVFVVKPALVADVPAALTRLRQAKADVVFSSALETAVGARTALQTAFAWNAMPPTAVPAKPGTENRKPESGNRRPETGDRRPETGIQTSDTSVSKPAGDPPPAAVPAPALPRALGFGVWPLFQDRRFDGPVAMPYVRADDVAAIDAEAVWTALS